MRRLLNWVLPRRGTDPRVPLWSHSCAFCPHGAGWHRWVKATQGEKISIDPTKTRCHKCYCPYYKDGGPRNVT